MYAGQIVEVRRSGLLHTDPLHPYTAALSGARPDIDNRTPRLRSIAGRPLSALEAPADACSFASRCDHRREVCENNAPELLPLDGGLSRCWRAEELRHTLTGGPK
jgi:oligopeptide/dipeptide ABC transporter ATP-binding protein